MQSPEKWKDQEAGQIGIDWFKYRQIYSTTGKRRGWSDLSKIINKRINKKNKKNDVVGIKQTGVEISDWTAKETGIILAVINIW